MHAINECLRQKSRRGAGRLAAFAAAGVSLVSLRAARADAPVAESLDALPGIGRVGIAGEMALGGTVSASAGYGFAGEVLSLGDSHHRAVGGLAASFRFVDWLAVSLRLQGRYDKHLLPENTSDDGWVGDPRLIARAGTALSGPWRLGGQVGVWFPGASAPSVVPSATSVDGLLLGSFVPANLPLVASVNLGFRFDQSSSAAEDAELLSLADKMSLGLSDSHAVLFGVGAAWRAGALELLGEWTWDLLVGSQAPKINRSPQRVSAGARYALSETLMAQLMVDVNVARTPTIDAMSALVPLEPRLAATVGISMRFGGTERSQRLVVPQVVRKQPAAPSPGGIAGRVLGFDMAPLAGARLRLRIADKEQAATTGPDGSFAFDALPPGSGELEIEADGHVAKRSPVSVKSAEVARLELTLDRELPPGQLRGVISSFDGKRVAANIQILPIGLTGKSDEHGEFQIDVPPGQYTVQISAPGYAAQERSVSIEQDGVTVLNVDLRRSK